PLIVFVDTQWQVRWGPFLGCLRSREGKTAEEVVEWLKRIDILADVKHLDQNLLRGVSLTDGFKPTFTTVCLFARETGNYDAVKLACGVSLPTRDVPDFVSALGGRESAFGVYCSNLVRTKSY
ncbi:unnamed protein product, partial [Ectocarpus sp. 6 AP-2014]